MQMKYENMVKIIADSNRTQFERGDILIKEMNRLSTDILDYRYAAEHYNGEGTVIEDKRNQIKNSLVLIKSDLDIYIEQMGMTETVNNKSSKRLSKIVDKM
jgi:hypothetical protein